MLSMNQFLKVNWQMSHFLLFQEEFSGVDERLHNLLTAYNNIVSFDVRHDLKYGREVA